MESSEVGATTIEREISLISLSDGKIDKKIHNGDPGDDEIITVKENLDAKEGNGSDEIIDQFASKPDSESSNSKSTATDGTKVEAVISNTDSVPENISQLPKICVSDISTNQVVKTNSEVDEKEKPSQKNTAIVVVGTGNDVSITSAPDDSSTITKKVDVAQVEKETGDEIVPIETDDIKKIVNKEDDNDDGDDGNANKDTNNKDNEKLDAVNDTSTEVVTTTDDMRSITPPPEIDPVTSLNTWGTYGYLTPPQEESLTAFLDGASDIEIEAARYTMETKAQCCLRFLRARQFDVPKALILISDCYKKLTDMKASYYASLSPDECGNCDMDALQNFYPHVQYGYDKYNRPILFEHTGGMNPNVILQMSSKKGLINYHWWSMEMSLDQKFTDAAEKARAQIDEEVLKDGGGRFYLL